jgi:formylglycine-generating enzyme required for sulfatase activity/predicted Ser/Thr protein kinase
MNPQRYERLKKLFLGASALSGDGRRDYLRRLEGRDAELRCEIERLLAADADGDGVFATADGIGGADPHVAAAARPDRIGNFQITGTLGAGGMGVVYRAEQEHPRRSVALKVLRPHLLSRRSARRFEHEAEVLARLQHPGIAHVYEAGRYDAGFGGQPFFVMELVDGLALMDFVERHEPTVCERLRLFLKICRAVEHAHINGVIHRDLKPANILVTAAAEPKILDFGVARLTDSDIRTTTLNTETGEIIGTVAYMSPEQVAGDTTAMDRRSDVYALGVILYELLAGTLPLDLGGQTIPEAVRIIREEDPAPLSSIDRRLRGDLDTIAAKALEKSPQRRYPSAAALADDLERHLHHEPIMARPPGVIDGLRKFARRHPAAAVGITGAFTVVCATAIVFLSMYGATRSALTEKRAALDGLQEANRGAAKTARDLWVSTSGDAPQVWLDREAQETARHAMASATAGGEALELGRFGEAAERFVDALAQWRVAELRRESLIEQTLERLRSAIAADRVRSAEEALGRLRALKVDDAVVRPLAAEVSLLQLEMVAVPPGAFAMGGNELPAERPIHTVHVAQGFRISATEITQGQFLAVMGRNPSIFADRLVHPVENVSWFDALDFCNRLSARTGLSPRYRLSDVVTKGGAIILAKVEYLVGPGFRLPTEAEWEYACRAGAQTTFGFGDSMSAAGEHMWNQDNSDGTTRPVGAKSPNAWGIYDMHGNVWEWCEDRWHANYTGAPADGSAWLDGGVPAERAIRGGCWADRPLYCRAAYRRARAAGTHLQYRGFRVVCDLEDTEWRPDRGGAASVSK